MKGGLKHPTPTLSVLNCYYPPKRLDMTNATSQTSRNRQEALTAIKKAL
jgi:hypothetical protein